MRDRGGRRVNPSKKTLRDTYHLPAYGYKDHLGFNPKGAVRAGQSLLEALQLGGAAHPLRRAQAIAHGKGGPMMFPFAGGKIPLKEFPSSVEGITMKRAKHGDTYLDYEGKRQKLYRRPYDKRPGPGERKRAKLRPSYGGSMPVVYNAVDHHGGIVGSIRTHMGSYTGEPGLRGGIEVPEVWIDPAFRRTSLFKDLARIPLATGREVNANVVNPKLFDVLARLAKKDQRFSSFAYNPWER